MPDQPWTITNNPITNTFNSGVQAGENFVNQTVVPTAQNLWNQGTQLAGQAISPIVQGYNTYLAPIVNQGENFGSTVENQISSGLRNSAGYFLFSRSNKLTTRWQTLPHR